MRAIFLVFIFNFVFLFGCASLRPVTNIPEGEDQQNNVTLLRNFNFYASAYHYWATLDDEDIAGLLVKQNVSFILPPGKHSLGVRCFGGLWPMWWHDQIHVVISNSVKRYFLLSPYFLGCAEIEEIQSSEGLDRLRTSTRINTGTVSKCNGRGVPYAEADDVICFNKAWP